MSQEQSIPIPTRGARTSDAETSHEAWREFQETNLGPQLQQVLKIARKYPGRSSLHMAELTYAAWLNGRLDATRRPLDRVQIARRLANLRDDCGLVEHRDMNGKPVSKLGDGDRMPQRAKHGLLWWPVEYPR